MIRLLQIGGAVLFCSLLFSACIANPEQIEPTTSTTQNSEAPEIVVTTPLVKLNDTSNETASIESTLDPVQTSLPEEELSVVPTKASPVEPTPSPIQSVQERIKEQVVILYTKSQGNAFPLLSWPMLTVLDQPVFHFIYGEQPGYLYVDDYSPRLDTGGRYLMVPGIEWQGAEIPSGPDDASTWLVDLTRGDVRELAQRPPFAVWSPDGQQIAYGKDDTLFLEDVSENGANRSVFSEPGFDGFFIQWSPDGQHLAAISTDVGPSVNGAYPPVTSTLWIVSAENGAARPLGSFPLAGREYSRRQLQWSPDGSSLFTAISRPNYVFTVDGQRIALEEADQILAWVPGQDNLLVRDQTGALYVINPYSREVTFQVTEVERRVTAWSFSNDGRYLAFIYQQVDNEPLEVFLFDLTQRRTSIVGTVAASIVTSIHWTPDNAVLILNDAGLNTPIWGLGIDSGGEAEALVEGTLLNVIQPDMLTNSR
jgi:dipeptidyl aminopeptidase/acylaminoacyl peptidase